MFSTTVTYSTFLLPLILIAGGLIAGFILERVFIIRLHAIAKKTRWEADDVVIEAMKNLVMIIIGAGGAYSAIFNLPFTPEATLTAKKIIIVIGALAITWFFQRLAAGLVKLYVLRGDGSVPSSSIFVNLTRVAVIMLGGLVILQILDQPITPLLTAMGVGGLAIALGLQETISNLFSGLNLLGSKIIRPGDFIELSSGESGFVEDINWRNTSIKGLASNVVIVPNSVIAKDIITNHSLITTEKGVTVKGSVEYDSDLEIVEKVIIDEAKKTLKAVEGGVSDFEPIIRFQEFGDSGIQFSAILRAKQYTDQFILKSEFIKRLHIRFQKEKIEFAYPTQVTINKKA